MSHSVPAPAAAPAPAARRLNWPFIIVASIVHFGAFYALLAHWSWQGLLVAGVGQVLFGWIGVSMGFHRLLTHHSFAVKPWLERVLATLGAMAVQGGPIAWVRTHLSHHHKADREGDPHSPRVPPERLAGMSPRRRFFARLRAFGHAHVGWMIRGGQRLQSFRVVRNLSASRYYRFLEVGQILLQLPLAALLYLIGGRDFVLYGVFVRIFLTWHATFCVNSVCHVWGSRRYRELNNDSRNNGAVALLTGGEGYHNNHHGQAESARFARRPWEFDPIWWLIRLLERAKLATDVVRPKAEA